MLIENYLHNPKEGHPKTKTLKENELHHLPNKIQQLSPNSNPNDHEQLGHFLSKLHLESFFIYLFSLVILAYQPL